MQLTMKYNNCIGLVSFLSIVMELLSLGIIFIVRAL